MYKVLPLLQMQTLPRPVYVRQEVMPAGGLFPEHQHSWNQLLYATSGVLMVMVKGERLFIPPEKAVWIPAGHPHQVHSEFGAELKSLYICTSKTPDNWLQSRVIKVSALLKQLIIEASGFAVEYPIPGYEADLVTLILATLPRLETDDQQLAWPSSPELYQLCQSFYEQPSQRLSTEVMAAQLAVSKRTLERRFMQETGMAIQQWLLQLKYLQAVELLTAGYSVTHVALELGYSSPSAFIYMFRAKSGHSPSQLLKSTPSLQEALRNKI